MPFQEAPLPASVVSEALDCYDDHDYLLKAAFVPFQEALLAGSSASAEPEPAPERADGSSAAPSATPWPATVVTVSAPPAVHSAPPAAFSGPAAEPVPASLIAAPALAPEIVLLFDHVQATTISWRLHASFS